MFQVIAIFDINVSQGSVATFVRCGGIFNADFIANLSTSQPVKELWKSATSDEVIVKIKGDVFLKHSAELFLTIKSMQNLT